MVSSRLRWRALAVLGALLASIMIEWPSTGFVMPAAINTTILKTYEMPSQMINFNNNINCTGGDSNSSTSNSNTNAFNLTRSNEISTNLNRNCSATSFNSTNYSSDDVIDSKNRSSSVNININSNNRDNIRNSNINNINNNNNKNNNDNSSSSSSSNSNSSRSSDRNCCSSDSIIDIKYKNSLTNYDDNIEKNIKISSSSSSSLLSPLSSSSLSKTPVISETNLNVNRIKKFSNNIYNKRKRKKINKTNINNNNNSVNVYHVTSETLRSLQISSSSSSSSYNRLESFKKRSTSENYEKQIMLQDSTFYDVTTIIPIIDNSTIFHYLSRTDRSIHTTSNQRYYQRKLNTSSNLDRNERSTNLSHISGPARKIQLYIKNRFIQLLPDGTINGTQDDLSDYTILQRTTVDVGQIKIQGVATCLYLCMDQCGTVYGSKVFTDDCVFNESMEQHNYNTYSSTFNSNSRRILYLALNRHGEPRKLQIPPTRPLGKLATYTKALTETVPQERVEQLIARTFGANRVKHGLRQLCDGGKPLIELTAKVMKEHPKCNINNTNNNNSNSNNNSNNNMNNNNQSKNSNEFAPAAVSGRLRISSQSTNSGSNNNSSSSINSNGNLKKKKKKRRCKPDEAEGSNCHRPQALKKRPHKGKCPPDDEACHLSRKNKKKQHQHQQQQQQHNREQQQQQQQHHHQSSKQNGGGGGGGVGAGNGNHKSKKKSNGQQHNNGKKGKHNGRTTTTTIRPTPTSTIPIQTTTPSMQFTSTEQQDNDGETDTDDLLTAASMEDDEDEDISSIPSIAEHTQLVGGVGDDFFYDNDYDV